MNPRLLDILVCPICKGQLDYDKKAQELICHADKLAYPIRDGIPTMWADQARDLIPALAQDGAA
ncbi:Trm112 family protein [Herbaspirillum sp. RTI4]|uniref:Trm112 family protein n=1 Tax=Herbaspirillum sp. RTI4 TaxID=3048640 RepID=UPI002AB4895C|nr:Trm112 family protein [Herbaspirillum sp. RTI4]MDY7577903.1 Trm112 family protein [Herbaspirillum sp. RTI4]MEA9981651.1 Trm112 family protein [Herbaspirillum sp. RTI4]